MKADAQSIQLQIHVQPSARDRIRVTARAGHMSIPKWILSVLDAAAGFELPPELPDQSYEAPKRLTTRSVALKLRVTVARLEMYDEAATAAGLTVELWAAVVIGVASGESSLSSQLMRLSANPRMFIPDTTEVELLGETFRPRRNVEAKAVGA